MAKTDFKNIDEYHAYFEGETVTRMKVIRDIIHQLSPDVTEEISYQIPCFKIGGKPLIYYSAYSNHLTLSYPFSPAFRKHFEAELVNYNISKSALQLPYAQELPVDFIKKIIAYRLVEHHEMVQNPTKKR
jgi:uncharacterized protein YdhG (YjbR/CyaY superfamily)